MRRRLTPGLRREELASLAGVGVTWYTWLEQGRSINVSGETLGRIARALRLSVTDTTYLCTLAAADELPVDPLPTADERVQLAVDSVDRTPAWAIDPLINVVAFNRLANLIYRFDEGTEPFARNHAWRMFADPRRARLLGRSWDRIVTSGVGFLRANYATRWRDPAFATLLSELRRFPEFERRWDAQHTAPTAETVAFDVYGADLGHLRLSSLRLLLPELPGFVLFLLPPADEATAATLHRLAGSGSSFTGTSNRKHVRADAALPGALPDAG